MDSNFENRVRNWAAWVMGRVMYKKDRCGSVENQYRSPQHWWPEEPSIAVDILDALEVEKSVSIANGFPKKWHQIIKGHYVMKKDARAICRLISIHWMRYEDELKKALQALKNRLK